MGCSWEIENIRKEEIGALQHRTVELKLSYKEILARRHKIVTFLLSLIEKYNKVKRHKAIY